MVRVIAGVAVVVLSGLAGAALPAAEQAAAKAEAAKAKTLYAEVRTFARELDGLQVVALSGAQRMPWTRRAAALREQGMVLGTVLDEYGACTQSALTAQAYWRVLSGMDAGDVAGRRAEWSRHMQACGERLAKPLRVRVLAKAKPAAGCLQVLSPADVPGAPVAWTCEVRR